MVVASLNKDSKKMVELLREEGIEAYEIDLSSIYSLMPKITKTIVDCFGLMEDGGVISSSGLFMLGIVINYFQ